MLQLVLIFGVLLRFGDVLETEMVVSSVGYHFQFVSDQLLCFGAESKTQAGVLIVWPQRLFVSCLLLRYRDQSKTLRVEMTVGFQCQCVSYLLLCFVDLSGTITVDLTADMEYLASDLLVDKLHLHYDAFVRFLAFVVPVLPVELFPDFGGWVVACMDSGFYGTVFDVRSAGVIFSKKPDSEIFAALRGHQP